MARKRGTATYVSRRGIFTAVLFTRPHRAREADPEPAASQAERRVHSVIPKRKIKVPEIDDAAGDQEYEIMISH